MSEEQQDNKQVNEIIALKLRLPEFSERREIQIPVNAQETLADFKTTLSYLANTQLFTTYNLIFRGINLSNLDEGLDFKTILTDAGVDFESKENVKIEIELKEKSYTLNTVNEHIVKFRELIGASLISTSSLGFGVHSGFSKFQDLELSEVKSPEESEKKTEEEESKESTPSSVELSQEDKDKLIEISSRLFEPITLENHSSFKKLNIKTPLKSLQISSWSPVPSQQKLRGDLLYLTLQTLENDTFHITAHASGFFVNKCSSNKFDPTMKLNEKGVYQKHFILYNLIESLSPLFVKTVDSNKEILTKSQPETYLIPTNCFVNEPWLVQESSSVQPDYLRSQLPLLTNGVDGADIVKDWNEDFQSIRELPANDINERIVREKLLTKASFEFTSIATKTAIAIVNNEIAPMNPSEDPSEHIFLRNGIFYSLGVDASGQFANYGGNEAARYAAGKDLEGVKCLNRLDAKGVSMLVTCIVDYLGKRVICQAPVPGIFSGSAPIENAAEEDATEETEADKVCYGVSTDGSKILTSAEFDAAFKPIAEAFHLKPHTAWTQDGAHGEIVTSKEVKGLVGTDGRKYIIDLYKTTPLDINFIEDNWTSEEDEKSYPHRQALIRHEAVEEWWRRKVSVLIKQETEKFEEEQKSKGDAENKDGEKPQLLISPSEYSLNPDAFDLVSAPTPELEKTAAQDNADVKEVSTFITDVLIPEFLKDISISNLMAPVDGSHLTSMLHKAGINLRYLGYIANQAFSEKQEELNSIAELRAKHESEAAEKEAAEKESKKEPDTGEEKETKTSEVEENAEKKEEDEAATSKASFLPVVASYETLHVICIQEMIARSVKHILRKLSFNLPLPLIPSLVAHFHNCLLGFNVNANPKADLDKSIAALYEHADLSFANLTPESVAKLVSKEVYARFRYSLPDNWTSSIRPVQLLREIAIKFGIQWKAQNYAFTESDFESFKNSTASTSQVIEASKSKKGKKSKQAIIKVVERVTTFVNEDIVNFVPIIKDSIFKSTLVEEVWETGRQQLLKGENEIGLNLFLETVSIYEQVYGQVHPETAKIYSLLSQTYSDLGMNAPACVAARRSSYLTERVSGFDSFETILSLLNAAFFENANESPVNSFKIYERLLSDWIVIYGSSHPSSVNTLNNLSMMLQQLQLVPQSLDLYRKTMKISDELNGPDSQISGMLKYQYAQNLLANSSFKEATEKVQEAYKIFRSSIGYDDKLTQDAKKLAINIVRYTELLAQNEQRLRQEAAQAAKTKSKVPAKPEAQSVTSKKNKKSVSPDPSIANQSVEDILKFIEGGNKKKQQKKKNNKVKN